MAPSAARPRPRGAAARGGGHLPAHGDARPRHPLARGDEPLDDREVAVVTRDGVLCIRIEEPVILTINKKARLDGKESNQLMMANGETFDFTGKLTDAILRKEMGVEFYLVFNTEPDNDEQCREQ